jgi:hypothetical protein
MVYDEGFKQFNGIEFYCKQDSQNPRRYRRMEHLGTQETSGLTVTLWRPEIQLLCHIPM